MLWWDERAAQLQRMGRDGERTKTDTYSDDEVRRAIIYTREDVVLLVSYLSSANEQLVLVARLLMAAVALLAIIAWRSISN